LYYKQQSDELHVYSVNVLKYNFMVIPANVYR